MNVLEKLGISMIVIFLIMVALIVLPILLLAGEVLIPVIAVLGAIIFIPIAIGIVIGSSGKGGHKDA